MHSAIPRFTGCLAMLLAGIASAGQTAPDNLRITLQFIEVPHPVLTELLASEKASGSDLRDMALALSKQGKSRIVDTCVVMGHCGRKIMLESIREEIFPTEYEPLSFGGPVNWDMVPDTGGIRILRTPTAFETRNTGVTFEVEPTVAENGETIDLRIVPEVVTPVRMESSSEYHDQWGDASIRMPIYETWRSNTSLSVEPGKFELVSVISPKSDAPVPAVSRKILMFVRADVIKIGG